MQDSETIFRSALAALNRHDVAAAVEHFAEDGVVVDYTDPTVMHTGRAAVASVIEGFLEVLPDMTSELLTVVASESGVAAELVMHGTPRGQAEPVALHYCVFYRFRGDKIASEHAYMDSASFPNG